ncbi:Lysosomal amino acid transporter 1 [Liparis tanakae]|uniref:Lysosomal amino acid transporter 1 n=1 Tax=Liparis tanakae TaxID=230148 RepID=A0A4Z2I3G1_9TELE|nr:Lysosomal amino acid transporter 1 [Liparis tanakae]
MATARFPGKSADVAANWTAVALGRPVCVNGTPWILYLLEECVENGWEYCSVVVGLVSMFCFLLSALPQFYEAYRNGKVEEAMSFGFLFFLFSGDLTSFAGCYLTSQLPIQIVTVVFYIFTDLILISQFLYYKIKNSSSRKSPVLKWLCFMWCGAATLVLLALPKLIVDNSATLDTQFQRQSTEGTSYLLFALAMMGNGTYGFSVIVVLPALKGSKQTFIIKHLAWLIGSLGVLLLDFFVTAQFIMYRKNHPAKGSALLSVPEVEPLLCEEVELSVL